MKKVILVLFIIALFTGCASVGFQSPQYKVQANTNGEIGSLEGAATSHMLFRGLIVWGDSGVVTAARKSGGKYIRTVDQKFTSYFGIYTAITTIVTTENTPPEGFEE